jgi:hypothetical protein
MGKAGKVGVAALVVPAAALSAVAAKAAVPVGTPDPKAIVLKAADFPAATDDSHTSIPGTGALVAGYENVVRFKKPYGASKYDGVDSTALVETDVANATAAYGRLARRFSSPATRKEVAKQIAGKLKGAKVIATKPRSLGVKDSSMEIGFVVIVPKSGPVNVSIELLRVDRIIVQNLAVGAGKTIAVADAKALVGLVAAHADALLVPTASTVPTIAGTAQVGQTLTASPGTWSGAAATYAYQWQDCDATGTTCTPIANATSPTYVVQATDANQTLRVTVTATNAYGTAPATSAITAPVAP